MRSSGGEVKSVREYLLCDYGRKSCFLIFYEMIGGRMGSFFFLERLLRSACAGYSYGESIKGARRLPRGRLGGKGGVVVFLQGPH